MKLPTGRRRSMTAVPIAVMLLAAKPVGDFIEQHPTIKMLALAFILLIGLALIAEGIHMHIPRGFIYFAIGFSLTVEFLNTMVRRRRERTAAASANPSPLADSNPQRRKPDTSPTASQGSRRG